MINGARSTAPACGSLGKKKKRKLVYLTLVRHTIIYWRECATSRARVDRSLFSRIINMTVRYLKNLSFYATCTYKCTRTTYIVLLPLRTWRGMGTAKSLMRRVYFRGRMIFVFYILWRERAKEENFGRKLYRLSSFIRHAVITWNNNTYILLFEIMDSSNDLAITDSPWVSIRAVHPRLLSQSRSFSLFFEFALYLWPLKKYLIHERITMRITK